MKANGSAGTSAIADVLGSDPRSPTINRMFGLALAYVVELDIDPEDAFAQMVEELYGLFDRAAARGWPDVLAAAFRLTNEPIPPKHFH